MITFIFGQDFAMSALPFQILIWNVAVIWISLHYGNTLIACNRQNQYLIVDLSKNGSRVIMRKYEPTEGDRLGSWTADDRIVVGGIVELPEVTLPD